MIRKETSEIENRKILEKNQQNQDLFFKKIQKRKKEMNYR